MKKEIPILFSTAMVQAILAGRKTQTRRIVKGEAIKWLDESGFTPAFVADPGNSLCPYGKPGDILWVRETWFPAAIKGNKVLISGKDMEASKAWEIETDNVDLYWKKLERGCFIPSIHMPKEAARIWLGGIDVRIERVQDISEDDAIAEGIEAKDTKLGISYLDYETGYCNGLFDAKRSFQSLWQSINGAESWDANPWIWSISFKVLSTTGKPALLTETTTA